MPRAWGVGSPGAPGRAPSCGCCTLKVSRLEVAAYLLVAMAAVARVLLPWLAPAHTAHWWVLAATAWTLAFGLYLWVFTPWLLTTRLDGKDG